MMEWNGIGSSTSGSARVIVDHSSGMFDGRDDGEEDDNQPSSSTPPPNMTFEERLADKPQRLRGTDMKVFVNGNKAFGIHKDIFFSLSPAFEFLIRKSTPQNDGKYSVKLQMTEEVFRVIKHFAYLKNLPNQLDLETALGVLKAAYLYNIDLLIPIVMREVKSSMTPEDAFKVLYEARTLEIEKLEHCALEEIFEHAEHLLKTEEFCKLGSFDVLRILSSDYLKCSEWDVFSAALSWATERAKISKEFKKRLVYSFREVEKCVRFSIMTPAELAKTALQAPWIMENEDWFQLYTYVCLPVSLRNKVTLKYESKPRLRVNTAPLPQTNVVTVCKETQTDLKAMDRTNERSDKTQDTGVIFSTPATTPASTPMKNSARKRPFSGDDAETVVSFANETNTTFVPKNGIANSDGESDEDSYLHQVTTISDKAYTYYEESLKRFYRDNDKGKYGGIKLINMTLDHIYRPIAVRNCTDVVLDFKCSAISKHGNKKLAAFANFVRHFDPMRFLVFDNRDKPLDHLKVENLWSLKQDIMLKINGVIFLKIDRSKASLTLNYQIDSCRILDNDRFRPKRLALSNCEFSTKSFGKIKPENGKWLKSLILYYVWGEYTMEDIMRDFPNLTELVCWKFIPKSWLKGSVAGFPLFLNLSNTCSARETLRKIVLYKAELKIPAECKNTFPNLSQLCLDQCHTVRGPSFGRNFVHVFPNLKKLLLIEENIGKDGGNLASSDLINNVWKRVDTIKWIRVIGMKWSWAFSHCSESEDEELASFLRTTGLPSKPTNFALDCIDGSWKGKTYDDLEGESPDIDGGYWSERDEMEYQWYSLENFYASSEDFEEYFLQDTPPTPILWY